MKTKDYVIEFFNTLEVWEDLNHGEKHKEKLCNNVISFLNKSDNSTATSVYETFFNAYWIGIQNEQNPFLDLLKKMKHFETNAGKLLKRHRDHYIHSVYVFILGIVIFTKYYKFQQIFNEKIARSFYKDFYQTKYEEFLYRWGLASLFHDIAYPLEITLAQVKRYLGFIYDYPEKKFNKELNIKMEIPNLNELINLQFLEPDIMNKDGFFNKYPNLKNDYLRDSISLIAKNLSHNLNIAYEDINISLYIALSNMYNCGFIDHGFYSSLIMLCWYHYLIYKTSWNPSYFYFPIVDSATAILLHNYYKKVLIKSPYKLGRLNPASSPIAFLLILCDELQDWNRENYGEIENDAFCPYDSDLLISNNSFSINYLVRKGAVQDEFLKKKRKDLYELLDIECIFPGGISLNAIYLDREVKDIGKEKSMC